MMDGFSDWIYRTYQSIVYGNTSDYYSGTYQTLKSNASNSFLSINNYADNPWTSWIIENYATVVIYVLVITILIVIVIGVLKAKKISWFFLAIVMVSKFIYINAISRRNNSICK